MRVPVAIVGLVVVFLAVGAGAVVWIGFAFDTVPIRWDPSIGNSCRAVDPATMADLRWAAAVPLALVTICSVGLSAVAGVVARRDAEAAGAAGATQIAVAISAVAGAVLLWCSYAIGHVFEVAGVLILGVLALLLVGAALGAARSVARTWEGLGRPFWLAVLQVLVVPAIVMARTFTDEIPIC